MPIVCNLQLAYNVHNLICIIYCLLCGASCRSDSEQMETEADCSNLKSIAKTQKSKGYCEFLSNRQKLLNKFR